MWIEEVILIKMSNTQAVEGNKMCIESHRDKAYCPAFNVLKTTPFTAIENSQSAL